MRRKERIIVFKNRQEAGIHLGKKFTRFKNENPIIIALPRGGLMVAFEVARILKAPLEVLVVRKIGAPHNSEFGVGAIAEGNIQIFDRRAMRILGVSKEGLVEVVRQEKEELKRRVGLYRNNKRLVSFKNRIVIVVDDGLATGVTARAAITAIKKRKPKQIIFASPVCEYNTVKKIRNLVDKVICVIKPVDFSAVGAWYKHFEQVTDEQVVEILRRSKTR